MRNSINSVSVGENIDLPAQTSHKNKKALRGVKTALVVMMSAAVLSGCLLEGDVSGNKARNELIAKLENSNGSSGGSTEGRESGGTGGTGESTGVSGASRPETGGLTNPEAMADHYPGTYNYSKEVDIPSCDGADAIRISTASGLSQIANSSYRVFCIAPGDYRSYGKLYLPAGGTVDQPKVIRFESSEFSDDEEIFTADKYKLARMPQIEAAYTSNWVLHRLAFMEISGMPMRMAGSTNIVLDRVRVEYNRNGIEFRAGTHDSYVQNSLIGNQVVPQGSGNDGVCVAFMGNFRQESDGNISYDVPVVMSNNRVVNNEIFNCNDGIQIVWMHHYHNLPDLHGTMFAGNDIYLDNSVRTDCTGYKDPNGNCTHMENPIDLKGGSLDPNDPVRIFDNRMWGYRKTDSNYNSPANSWGSAISGHYRATKNIHIYENVMWDVPSGISFSRGTTSSTIRDNIITEIRGEGINNGIALVTFTGNHELNTYINVDDMTVERNHIIVSTDGSSTGAAWLSSSATNSDFSCNVVANGAWSSGNIVGGNIGQNTWFNTNSGSLSRGSDNVVSSFDSSEMGRLCFDTKRASIPGGEQVCLDGVLDKPTSSNVCASEYWTTDNWPNS